MFNVFMVTGWFRYPSISYHVLRVEISFLSNRPNASSHFFLREQVDREQALDDFKTGRAKILIATDVASRGLDIRGVT